MPHSPQLLQDLLLLLLASVPIAFIFNRLRLPTIVGFIITGVLIGPYGLRLIRDVEAIDVLAELGVVLPVLGGTQGGSVARIVLTLVIAIGAIALIILTARIIVPYLLHHIVRLRSSEVFIISIVVLSLGTSWLTSQFGLSLALGAFIAGIVLSESEYSHQIVADILPFRDVFNSVFFISIGMLLSLSSLAANLPIVLGWVGMLIAGKTSRLRIEWPQPGQGIKKNRSGLRCARAKR